MRGFVRLGSGLSHTHESLPPDGCAINPAVWCHVPVVRRWRSDSLTVIKTPEGIDSNKIVKNAYSRYNLSIGIGLSQVCV